MADICSSHYISQAWNESTCVRDSILPHPVYVTSGKFMNPRGLQFPHLENGGKNEANLNVRLL